MKFNNKNISLGMSIFIPLLYFIIYYSSFKMPYGFDEIIQVWPIGKILTDSDIINFPKLLASSFLGEDHLMIFSNLISYLIYSDKFDSVKVIGLVTKIVLLLIILAIIWMLYSIKVSKVMMALIVGVLLTNQSLMFYHFGYNITFSLALFFSILSLSSVFNYINTGKNNYIYIFCLSSIFGIFTFENYFITFPIVICTIIILSREHFLKFAVIIFLVITSYSVIHYLQYDTFLPGSRIISLSFKESFFRIFLVFLQIINDWLFGIPKYLIKGAFSIDKLLVILMLITLFYLINVNLKFKISRLSATLLICAVSAIPFILYTGRFHYGLWTFPGILFNVGLALCFIKRNGNKFLYFKNENLVLVLVLLFMLLSIMVNSSGEVIKRYNNNYYDSIDAYELLGSPLKNIKLVKQSTDLEEINPLAFWLGNQLFYKNGGLKYIQNYNVLHPEDANILLTNFNKNLNINLILNDNSIYMHEIFRNSQIQYRFFNNQPDGKIFKAIPLRRNQDLKFDFDFNSINSTKNSLYKIVLTFDRQVSALYTIIFLSHSKDFIIENQNSIVFYTDVLQKSTPLEVLNVSKFSRLNSIVIYDLSKYSTNKNINSINRSDNLKKVFNFRSNDVECRLSFKSDFPTMINLYSSLSVNSNYQLNIFSDENINTKVQFSNIFSSNKAKNNQDCHYFDKIE